MKWKRKWNLSVARRLWLRWVISYGAGAAELNLGSLTWAAEFNHGVELRNWICGIELRNWVCGLKLPNRVFGLRLRSGSLAAALKLRSWIEPRNGIRSSDFELRSGSWSSGFELRSRSWASENEQRDWSFGEGLDQRILRLQRFSCGNEACICVSVPAFSQMSKRLAKV